MAASTQDVASCLSATLSPDTNTRIAAEIKLAEYLAIPETGLVLSQLIMAQDAELPLRQSASIVLRKFVLERWSPFFPSFKGNAPSVEIKNDIRQAVFHCLSDPNRKIRSLSARALSSIANCDWPEEYPDLLTSLIALLSSGSSDSVHGAMQVFTEFIKSDLTEDQILPVLRQLLPVLLTILGAKDQHSAVTRARTISVFRQCVAALYMVKDQYPQPVKEATASVLPVWLEAFKVLLNIDPQEDVSSPQKWEGLAIRIQIFRTLDHLHTSFPRSMTPYLNDLMSTSLTHLRVLFPAFVHYYLSSSESVPTSSEDDPIELPHLICPIIDFIAVVARGGKAKDWFQGDNTLALTSAIFNFVQMTDDDEETWANNANAFVAQEDDDTQAYSTRVAGFDLLACLIDRSPAVIVGAFQATLNQVLASSQQERDSGKSNWWRPLEAALAAIGSQADAVIDCIEDEQDSGRESPLNMNSYLTGIIPSVLSLSECPFLQGRGFVFASQYAKFLPAQLTGQYLEAAIHVIEATDASIPVKISAVKAIHNFYQGSTDNQSLLPFVSKIATDLVPFLTITSDDTLSLVLETIAVVLDVDDGKWMSETLASSLVTTVLEVWRQNSKDPIFLSIITDILSSLASSSPQIYQVVVKQALPLLCSAITTHSQQEPWVAASAIELISSLISGAKEGHLGDGFFAVLGPCLFPCLQQAEDRDILQNGISCLTLVVRRECSQLLAWSNPSGSGLDNVLRVVAKLLQSPDESGGLFIGDLIIHLFRRAGPAVLPVLPELLQAMVGRMMSAKTVTFLQSLVIPFAYLISNMRDEVLTLLESTDVEGRSGLDILMQTWCENAETFQGFWPTRISTLSLSQLVECERPSLQTLMVKGEIIVKPETQNAPHEFTSVTFPVKALKLLLHDVLLGGESATINSKNDNFDVGSDDGDEDWTEEENQNQGFKEDEFAYLSEMLGPRGVAFDNDEVLDDNDDEDLKNDAVSTMDMQGHLLAFFRGCAARNTANFSSLVEQLSAEEMMLVRRIVQEGQA